ncbi:GNAT family N-acetyltransferase [Rickettsia endosymbiont of Oedothorax gibbosus]|uniref:hypothetical protein n=1 Tax=Rickettsia endosymbiont of Oedothorax gibbosus TaxID=931099 RepID=UPI00202418D0
MVIDKEQSENQESDIVEGYQVIGNSNSVSTGELAYLFAPKYHRGEIYQNVGYECVGALVLYYGQRLHDNGTDITIKIAGLEKSAVAPFKMVSATVRTDNPGSYKILDKLGFNKNPNIVQKYNDCERHEYFKPYGNESYVDVLQLTSTALLGETTSDLDIVD